jgi:hypothetical protein
MTYVVTRLVKRNWSPLIRLTVIGAMLCVLPAIGWLTAEVPPALVLLALLAPVGVLAVMKYLELGIVAMSLAAIFIRFRIPTGTTSEIVISLVICLGCIGLWIVNMLVVEKRLALKPAMVNAPLLAFIVTVPVSWVWGRAFRDALVTEAGHPLVSVVAGLVMMLLPGCLILVANNIRSVGWLRVLVWTFLGAGLVALFIDLGSDLGIGPIWALRNILSANRFLQINTHGLLSMWCLSFALGLALFHRRLHWFWRGLLLVQAAGWIYWGFFLRITWLSGWVPTFVAAAVVALFRSKKLFILLVILAIAGAGVYYWRTSYENETQESGVTRLAAYEVNWRVTGKHLLFGTGPAGYASYYMSYFPTEAMASHSNYIDILAQTGIVGMLLMLWFLGAQLWGGYKLWLRLQGQRDFAESLSVAVLAGTAGCTLAMALGDWVIPFAYTQGIVGFDLAVLNWLFMASLWALKHNLDSETSTAGELRVAETASL